MAAKACAAASPPRSRPDGGEADITARIDDAIVAMEEDDITARIEDAIVATDDGDRDITARITDAYAAMDEAEIEALIEAAVANSFPPSLSQQCVHGRLLDIEEGSHVCPYCAASAASAVTPAATIPPPVDHADFPITSPADPSDTAERHPWLAALVGTWEDTRDSEYVVTWSQRARKKTLSVRTTRPEGGRIFTQGLIRVDAQGRVVWGGRHSFVLDDYPTARAVWQPTRDSEYEFIWSRITADDCQ